MKSGIQVLIMMLLLTACGAQANVAVPAGWGQDVAAGKPIIARRGGITHGAWGDANDFTDFGSPTNPVDGGRWANNTNEGDGTYEVVDLGAMCQLMGVSYRLDWDGAFQNPLTVQVEVSADNEIWATVSQVVHPYSTPHVSNHVDVNLTIDSGPARYIRFSLPPDGAWNGWGDFFQLRAYVAADE